MWWAKSAPGSVNQGFRDRRIGKFGATLRLSGREKKFEQQKGLYEKVLRIWEIMCVIFSRDDPSWTFGRSPSWKWRQLQHWNMPTRAEVTLGICILLLCLCLVMCTVIVYCDCVWIWHWSLSTKAQTRLKTSILFVFIFYIVFFIFIFSLCTFFSSSRRSDNKLYKAINSKTCAVSKKYHIWQNFSSCQGS